MSVFCSMVWPITVRCAPSEFTGVAVPEACAGRFSFTAPVALRVVSALAYPVKRDVTTVRSPATPKTPVPLPATWAVPVNDTELKPATFMAPGPSVALAASIRSAPCPAVTPVPAADKPCRFSRLAAIFATSPAVPIPWISGAFSVRPSSEYCPVTESIVPRFADP